MEHLWAVGTGSTFAAHRGNVFLKVIQINTRKQLALSPKISQNSECHLHIRNRNDHAQFAIERTIKFMWFNAADPNPGEPQNKFPWKEYLVQAVQNEIPDVLVFTSTGSVCNKADIAKLLAEIGHQLYHITNVGIDAGQFVVSGNGNVAVMLKETMGFCIHAGILFDCDWY